MNALFWNVKIPLSKQHNGQDKVKERERQYKASKPLS